MVVQLGKSGDDAVNIIMNAIERNKESYGSVLIRFVVVKEKENNFLHAGRIDFLHKDTNVTSETYDYTDVVLLKQVISVDQAKNLIQTLSHKGYVDHNNETVWIEQGGFEPPCLIPSRRKWSYITYEWPYVYCSYYIGRDHSSHVNESSLVKPNLPAYPNLDDAVQTFLELDSRMYNDRRIIIIVPDYRARIQKVLLSNTKLTIKIDSKEPARLKDIIGKFYLRASENKFFNSEDLKIQNMTFSCPCNFEPEFIGAYLLTENGDRLDYREISTYGTSSEDLVFETPASLVEDLVRRGESDRVEFKREMNNDTLLESIVSFANTEGGVILVGVDNNSKLVGFNHEISEVRDRITNSVVSRCDPPINVEVESVSIDSIPILLIRVPNGTDKPYIFRDKGIFVRRNATNRQITRHELDEFYESKQQDTSRSVFV